MYKTLLVALTLCSSTITAQTWTQQANAPAGRHHPISFTLNGIGYAVTGTASNNLPTNAVYDYNPVTNTWGTLPNFPGTARSFGIGAVTNGLAYLGFGASASAFLNDFWSFDATDSSWTQLANCGCTARRHPAMVAIGDKIYVGLGDGVLGDLDDWWMYDIPTNVWTQIADLPGPGRHHPFMFNVGGDVFAGLGHSGQIVYRDWYKLDTATNLWTTMSLFPGQARVAGTQFSANGYGYVLSGDGANHSWMATGEMWRYDPVLDSWTQLTAHPGQSRWAPGSFVINNEVYFFGGLNRFTSLFPTDLWKFNLGGTLTSIYEENQNLSNTIIYPNPADDFLNWESDLNITEIRIFNTVGQLFSANQAETQKLDISNLDDGLYLVQFYDNHNLLKTSKVLIQH